MTPSSPLPMADPHYWSQLEVAARIGTSHCNGSSWSRSRAGPSAGRLAGGKRRDCRRCSIQVCPQKSSVIRLARHFQLTFYHILSQNNFLRGRLMKRLKERGCTLRRTSGWREGWSQLCHWQARSCSRATSWPSPDSSEGRSSKLALDTWFSYR